MGSIDAALRAGRKLDMAAAATSVTATLANVMGSWRHLKEKHLDEPRKHSGAYDSSSHAKPRQ
jgi:hypothetical protein